MTASKAVQMLRKTHLHSLYSKFPYCHYCGIKTILAKDMKKYSRGYENLYRLATLDHKILQASGGKDVAENFVLACFTCNNQKSNKYTYAEFLEKKKNEGKENNK